MELLLTFSHSHVRKRVIMPVGEAATQDGRRTLPAVSAGILVTTDG